MEIIDNAVKKGQTTLSEFESKSVLSQYGVPVTKEFVVTDENDLKTAIQEIGFPLVLKGCGEKLAHKTERNLVRVGIQNEADALATFQELYQSIRDEGGVVLVQEMIQGRREFVVGLVQDEQFGPCVMFGLGGILTEALKDVVFRPAPLNKQQALQMIDSIKSRKLLDSIRGMPPVDLDQMADIIMKVGQIGVENDRVREIDINPVIIDKSQPIAVDALVILNP